MRSKVVTLGSRQVRYVEAGGGGDTLILIHAFPLNADQWLPQLARAPEGWRVIAPDLRGFHGTSLTADGEVASVSMDTYAGDVLHLMDHLEIAHAVIGGLSMGGYVAFALMGMASARVSGLVLADTRATADTADARDGRDRMVKLVRGDGPSGVAQLMVPKLLGETTRREQPDLGDAVTHLILSTRTDGITAAILAMKARPDSTPLLATIRCPTTIICGAEDTITPVADSEALHHAVPGSRLVVLPRAGHLSNLEDPHGFNAALFMAPPL